MNGTYMVVSMQRDKDRRAREINEFLAIVSGLLKARDLRSRWSSKIGPTTVEVGQSSKNHTLSLVRQAIGSHGLVYKAVDVESLAWNDVVEIHENLYEATREWIRNADPTTPGMPDYVFERFTSLAKRIESQKPKPEPKKADENLNAYSLIFEGERYDLAYLPALVLATSEEEAAIKLAFQKSGDEEWPWEATGRVICAQPGKRCKLKDMSIVVR